MRHRLQRLARMAPIGLTTLSALAGPLRAQTDDREGVRRAVLDYVEGFYEGDSAKLARSVRPEIFKYGFWKARDSTRYAGEQMKYPEFFDYAPWRCTTCRTRRRARSSPRSGEPTTCC